MLPRKLVVRKIVIKIKVEVGIKTETEIEDGWIKIDKIDRK